MPIAAVSVQCANRPAPKPISATPMANSSDGVQRRGEDHRAETRPARPARRTPRGGRDRRPRPSSRAASAEAASGRRRRAARVSAVVVPTVRCSTWPPYGSSRMSCMLNATVPRPRATRRRVACGAVAERAPGLAERRLHAGRARCAHGSRASCFHSAITFSTIVASAVPWITWISRISVKCASSAPKTSALADHAQQQHHAQQRDDARMRLRPARGRSPAPARPSASCAGRRPPAGTPAPRRPGRR